MLMQLCFRFRILSLTLLVAVCVTSSASSNASESSLVPKFPVVTYELANGLKVALSHDPDAPRTTVCMAYHVGSKNERPGLTGFAHFFEHMMFRGTRNVPDFDIPLQQAGGSPNAFTSEDVTVYFETVPNDYVKRALYMEAERMAFLSSDLDQRKFDTEREVVKNERRQRMENVPYGLADETISYYAYPQGHPYSWSVIGSMRDLDNATLDDLRQFFLEFYHPGNATLTLVGGVGLEDAKRWIELYYGPIAPGPDKTPLLVPPAPAISHRVIQKDRVEFPRVYWTWPVVAESHPDAPALDLLAMILGDGDASRLQQSLVVRAQVATEVDAANEASEVGGLFKITATLAPGESCDDLESRLAATVRIVRQEGVSSEEVARTKAKYRTDTLVGLTSPTQRAFVIAMGLAQHGDPHYYQTVFRRSDAVSAEDIQRVAQQYLVDDKVVLVVQPIGEGEQEDEAVLAGPLPDDAVAGTLEPRSHQPGPDWSSMPAATTSKPFTPPRFQRRSLSNGLEVWIAKWATLPLISGRLVVRSGSANAPSNQAGIAALTGSLWDQGTTQLTATELAEAFDALGTTVNTSVGTNTTQLGFTVESRSLESMMELVGDMVAAPRLAQEDFLRERKLQLSELASGRDSASWIAGRVFPTLVFGRQHPYAVPQTGYAQSVQNLSVDQVRQFYQSRFVPGNAILILVGDCDPQELVPMLEDKLGKWQGREVTKRDVDTPAGAQTNTVYVVDKPGAVQSILAVGRTWRGRQDDSFFATRIGNRILGGDFLSRINQNLRNRNGFTYGARSGFQYYEQGSVWDVMTSVRSEVTGAALREVFNELRDVRVGRPLTPEEIEVARAAEMSVFPRSFETPASIASALVRLAVHQLPADYYQTYLQQLRTAAAPAVSKTMAELVDSDFMRVLVVGDLQTIRPLLKEAGFASLRELDTNGQLR
jgi:zinc protease